MHHSPERVGFPDLPRTSTTRLDTSRAVPRRVSPSSLCGSFRRAVPPFQDRRPSNALAHATAQCARPQHESSSLPQNESRRRRFVRVFFCCCCYSSFVCLFALLFLLPPPRSRRVRTQLTWRVKVDSNQKETERNELAAEHAKTTVRSERRRNQMVQKTALKRDGENANASWSHRCEHAWKGGRGIASKGGKRGKHERKTQVRRIHMCIRYCGRGDRRKAALPFATF